MSQFRYSSLKSSRAIRLLRFLHEPGTEPVCQMITVEVEKAPPFVALSYTWGAKENSRAILVDDAVIPITKNLGEAIDAISPYVMERSMMFWADSICINQADIDERSRQVRLMNTIYRSAEIVAIWLGLAEDDSDLAFDMMMEWKPRFDVLSEQCGGDNHLAMSTISPEDPFFFGLSGSKERRAHEALCRLSRRQWWTRAWVVQEGTVAYRARTVLFCGDRSTDWDYIRTVLWIRYAKNDHNFNPDDRFMTDLDDLRGTREYGTNIKLLRLLHLMRMYECEDPHDKVYAALGMAMDVHENDIIPDYTKTCAEVYTDVAKFCISNPSNQPFDFLSYAVRSAPGTSLEFDHNPLLPSWIPDWTICADLRPLDKECYYGSKLQHHGTFNACAALSGEYHFDHRTLQVQGSVLDRITQVMTVCDCAIIEGGLDIVRSWAPPNPQEPYLLGQTKLEAYNHTIFADIGETKTGYNWDMSRGFAMDWELTDRASVLKTPEELDRHYRMMTDLDNTTFARRMFVTSCGFMGLGPAAAQVGDSVCVLLGGQLLYVLRGGDDGKFEFVGECYVHGMMDGKACEEPWFLKRDFVLV